ncbi:hypothetical protein PNOK_0393400 [Pyrrhoderma noxium]|uniref:N-acetyltransferase domain-containing protein n=1 Tax=Pyrrhoderma noxium TaxID=2282107 RepID=A0A286UNX7_9AGAM|nr:hypothetical protein PNOK_0393400 [Pyrrhoderma noxium]
MMNWGRGNGSILNSLPSLSPLVNPNDTHSEKLFELKDEVPLVVPLLSEHLDNAYVTFAEAFENDPLVVYLTDGRGPFPPLNKPLFKRLWKAKFSLFLKHNIGLTINAGESNILVTPAASDRAPTPPSDKLKESFFNFLSNTYFLFNYKHLRRRYHELELKVKAAIKDNLGDSVEETVYIDGLATKPAAQGQGYASALMRAVLFTADIRNRSVYLFTGNSNNIAFYETFGYKAVTQFELGKDDPSWEETPVIVTMMIRSPLAV